MDSKKSYTVEFKNFEAEHDIVLKAEICCKWGYDYKCEFLEEFASDISKEGFNVILTCVPIFPGDNEFIIYQEYNGQNNILYNNNKSSSAPDPDCSEMFGKLKY